MNAEDPTASSHPTPPSREDLEREILGEPPSLTVEELVGDDEGDRDRARRLWRALGFPDPGAAVAFTPSDAEAMELISDLVDTDVLDLDTAVRLTRAVGRTMARLADWQVATLSEYVETLEHTGRGSGSRIQTGLDVVRSVEPPFEQLMLYAWRRHLAASVGRVEALGAEDSDLHQVTVTVGFADLVSFTRLSNGIDEDHLADLVEVFESACSDVITARGGRVIKTLGDSVLFVAAEPRTGADVASDIVDVVGAEPSLPDVHVGLATGQVVLRLGDVFGPTVNLASRLTGVARRNRVIVDRETAEAVEEDGDFVLRPLAPRSMHGFGVVTPINLRRR